MIKLEKEFQDFAECYKYDVLKQRLVDFYAALIAPYHLSEYPEATQEIIIKASTELANLKLENIKSTDKPFLVKSINNAWKEELKKVGLN